MNELPGRAAPPPGPEATADAAPGWPALARRIEEDARCRAALAATGVDLQRPAVDLAAHLRALRGRLQALRDAAHAAALLGAKATRAGRNPNEEGKLP